MARVTEGSRYSHEARGLIIPSFCPVCGRALVRWHSVEGNDVYPSLICYGAKIPLTIWLEQHLSIDALGRDALGSHYQFFMPPTPAPLIGRFDRATGEPVANPIDPPRKGVGCTPLTVLFVIIGILAALTLLSVVKSIIFGYPT